MTLSTPRLIAGEPELARVAAQLLHDHCPVEVVQRAEAGEWPAALWDHLVATGLTEIGRTDGDPGGIVDAVEVLRLAGGSAAPVPLAEAMLGGWVLDTVGLDVPGAMLAVPCPFPGDGAVVDPAASTLRATFGCVPWASRCDSLVVVLTDGDGRAWCATAPRVALQIETRRNLAAERRDRVVVDGQVQLVELTPGAERRLELRAALSRAALSAGAMSASVALAAEYARERRQFGKPIAAFQAVQHLLALAAEAAASAQTATMVAADALATDATDPGHRVAVARVLAHQAMEVVSKNCHQVFGAIGVTKEHELHLRTRRLWAWDVEWGSPAAWAAELTDAVAAGGTGSMWRLLVQPVHALTNDSTTGGDQ